MCINIYNIFLKTAKNTNQNMNIQIFSTVSISKAFNLKIVHFHKFLSQICTATSKGKGPRACVVGHTAETGNEFHIFCCLEVLFIYLFS